MIRAGTLPLRKPGIWIWDPIVWYALSRSGFSSSKGTSTMSLTRVGLRVSTALFTSGTPHGWDQWWCGPVARGWDLVRTAPRRLEGLGVGVGVSTRHTGRDHTPAHANGRGHRPESPDNAHSVIAREGYSE